LTSLHKPNLSLSVVLQDHIRSHSEVKIVEERAHHPAAPHSSAVASLTQCSHALECNYSTLPFQTHKNSSPVRLQERNASHWHSRKTSLAQRKTHTNVELKRSSSKMMYKRIIPRRNFTDFKYPHPNHTPELLPLRPDSCIR